MFPFTNISFRFSKFQSRIKMEKLKRRFIEEMCRFLNKIYSTSPWDFSTMILPLAIKCKYCISLIYFLL
ncbi:scavenger receptor class B member 1-like isoform X2 [Vespula maculifrons]|uniref:Scavenger receptor class B member 1-like isoform X2 n=1 Tax=Vespula maculifrons TaxID=7453 RepID=A0ABD2D1Z6_VESMC